MVDVCCFLLCFRNNKKNLFASNFCKCKQNFQLHTYFEPLHDTVLLRRVIVLKLFDVTLCLSLPTKCFCASIVNRSNDVSNAFGNLAIGLNEISCL